MIVLIGVQLDHKSMFETKLPVFWADKTVVTSRTSANLGNRLIWNVAKLNVSIRIINWFN